MTRPPHRPSLVVPDHSVDNGGANLTENSKPAEKDRLMGERFDLTPARVIALSKAVLGRSDNKDNATELGILAISPGHFPARRAEAIAALTGLSESTGKRISKHETGHADTWPLLFASILQFLTLQGAIAYVCAATGMDEDEAEALLRRHLGPEIQP